VSLHARNLQLSVAGRSLCAGLTVDLEAGENWVILGANGSGKTTLLLTLAGLRAPEGGSVLLGNDDLSQIPARVRAHQLGVLFQDPESDFPATVLETVLTGRYPYLDRWQWQRAEDVHAAEVALETLGLSSLVHRPLATLSGGERRRVEIATVLAQDAPIALLDEPINHLDLRYQIQVLDVLAKRALKPGHLNVFVLHDINLALRYCTHGILLFDDGECSSGRLTELIQCASLEKLYHCPVREVRIDGSGWFVPA